jgi:hypothetical protein
MSSKKDKQDIATGASIISRLYQYANLSASRLAWGIGFTGGLAVDIAL